MENFEKMKEQKLKEILPKIKIEQKPVSNDTQVDKNERLQN